LFGADGGVAADLVTPWLPWFALGTLALAALGALAAVQLRTLVAYLVIMSAGTLLLAVGLGTAGTLAAGLFYLVSSTFVAAALFLLTDLMADGRGAAADAMVPAPLAHRAAFGALFFLFALEAAGLPPSGGFVGKALLLRATIGAPLMASTWAAVLLSGLGVMIALARAGSTVFWKASDASRVQVAASRGDVLERAAIAWFALAMFVVLVNAGGVARYAEAAAAQLHERRAYISAVLDAEPAPPAWTPRTGMAKP
jgi:multicomponent K+:H+ antiporter subunit D